MYGYDTLVCALGQSGLPDAEWQGVQESRVGDSRQVRAWCNLPIVQVSYHEARSPSKPPFSELRIQASLPKALWNTNAQELTAADEIRAALEQVAAAAAPVLGYVPDLLAWDVRRVDVTADRVLETEAHVQAALEALARVRIRRRLAVRGEAGTVSWPAKRGGFTRKAYSKYVESHEEAAKGRLRVEIGCMGQKALKKVHPGPIGSSAVRVCDLLSEEAARMRERVARGMVALVDRVIEEAVDVDAMRAFWAFKAGDRRSDYAGRMLGYALLVQRFGWSFLDGVLDRVSVYRVRKEFERVGIQPEEIEFGVGSHYAEASAWEELAETGDGDEVRRVARRVLDKEFPLPPDEQV